MLQKMPVSHIADFLGEHDMQIWRVPQDLWPVSQYDERQGDLQEDAGDGGDTEGRPWGGLWRDNVCGEKGVIEYASMQTVRTEHQDGGYAQAPRG